MPLDDGVGPGRLQNMLELRRLQMRVSETWDQWANRAKRTDIDPPAELTMQRLPPGLPVDHDANPDTRIGFIDTETTGTDPLHDEITELALVVVNGRTQQRRNSDDRKHRKLVERTKDPDQRNRQRNHRDQGRHGRRTSS